MLLHVHVCCRTCFWSHAAFHASLHSACMQAEDLAGSPMAESTGSSGSGELGKTGSLKRQSCTYFLSGFCRNGLACHDYHGVVPESGEVEVCVCVCVLCLFLGV